MAAKPKPNSTQQTPQNPTPKPPPLPPVAPATSILAADDAVSFEKPCVSLFDWWLVRVQDAEGKIAVAGSMRRNHTVGIFTSAPIIKRYDACTLETADGIIVLIQGSLSISRMLENGFSLELSDRFLMGFPIWWDNTALYAEKTTAHMASQPISSVSSSWKGSTHAYLEKFQLGNLVHSLGSAFIGNLVNSAKWLSGDDADAGPFRRSSCLSDEMPRFEEYISSDNGSSMTDKAAFYINDNGKGCATVCKEVCKDGMNLTVGSTSKEECPCDINLLSLSVAPTEACSSDKAVEEAENQNEHVHTDAREEVSVNNLAHSVLICDGTANHMSCDLEDGSTKYARSSVDLRSKDLLTMVSSDQMNYIEVPEDVENISTINMRERQELGLPRASADSSVDHDASREVIGVLNLGCERTHEVSFKKRGYQKITEDKALNEQIVPSEDFAATVSSNVTSIEYDNQHLGPLEEESSGKKMLQGNPRLRMPKRSRSYVHQSPLTRGKAKALSISTPESLKLRRTRSGRVVVPRLDLGCQSLIYDRDGLISGISGTELEWPSKGSMSEPVKRRKRSH